LQNKEEEGEKKNKEKKKNLENVEELEALGSFKRKKQREDVDEWWEGCSLARRKWGIGIIIFLLVNLFFFDQK